ncbi:MAG: ethanolamine ammonia-lyase reactivating factor EutA [Clostridiales bacterium]|nr:ethanolamine ammonia-lyase reactivating factor EutA [Clostridiales bacterium]
MQSILSVGIDIGTSTTQVIFSRLSMENTAGYFTVPHISIISKDVIYKSDIYITPLKTRTLIDADAVGKIVEAEYSKAGFSPRDVNTGAVIITGESARKENSEEVLSRLSGFAGEFVVSTAGPDLEAIVAGKGSGAASYSDENGVTVVNLDIGGGTSNIVLFDSGESKDRGCVDIGGRLIKLREDMTVTYISESAQKIAKSVNVNIEVGSKTDEREIRKICDRMAELLYELVSGNGSQLLEDIKTPGSTDFKPTKKVRAVCFSGGVADLISENESDSFKYGDIGVILGRAIRDGKLYSEYRVIKANETIRATVVGAGTYTTSVSGSTIDYTEGLFPLKNIPVLRFTESEQKNCFNGDIKAVAERIKWFLSQSDSENAVIAMRGEQNPSYMAVKKLADTLSDAADSVLKDGLPVIVVLECDMAKILGSLMKERLLDKRPVISIDSVKVDHNDFVDMGKPLMDGMVIPVVVKTLIFG